MRQAPLKVAAVIPAFNEEKSVGEVVKVARAVKAIEEVLVVNDGSIDQTALQAKKAGAKVLSLGTNQGKGEAMQRGVEEVQAEIIVFLDADILGLRPEQISRLLKPVLERRCQMVTGTLERGKQIDRFNDHLEAPLSGLRVVTKELWEMVPAHFKKGYLIESGLYWTAKHYHLRTKNFILSGLHHLTKIEKQGKAKGVWNYLKMWGQIGFSFPYHLFVWWKKGRGTKVA